MYRFIPVVLFAVVIVGCSSVEHSANKQDFVPVEKSYVGTIQSHSEYIADLESNYVLLTDASSRVYLHSFLHDLSQYENARVRVGGIYQPMRMAESSIDVLNVDSVDELDVVKNIKKVQAYQTYKFDALGFDAKLPKDIEAKIISDSALFAFENTNFTLSLKSPNLDFDSYLNQFSEHSSDILKINDNLFYLYFISDFESLYVFEYADLAVELKVSKFESSLQSSIDKVLENIEIAVTNVDLFETNSEFDVVEQASSVDALEPELESSDSVNIVPEVGDFNQELIIERSNELTSVANPVVEAAENLYQVESTNLNSNQYRPIIAAFELSSNNLLSDLAIVSRYYFAESKHFYVEYLDKKSQPKRVLVSYDENLKVIARFVEDEVMDWKLVSGENFIYDQKLTLVEKSGDVVDIKEGFRLFESLPLEFSLQYPMHMYYMRISDQYEFASDPNLEATTFSVERLDGFDINNFYKVDTNLYFNGQEYIKVLPQFYVRILNFGLSQSELDYILSTIKLLSL